MTLIGHAALGAAVYGVARPRHKTLWGMTRRTLLLCCLLLPMLPDADVIMHIWVKYGHPLGHRGFTHSMLFSIVVGVLTAWLLARLGKLARSRPAMVKASALFVTLLASHALTDAMTTGGKAPMLMWPFSTEGQWAPSRVIPVSPMGKSLLRTEWSDKQLKSAASKRKKLLRGKAKTHWLVRRVVRLSKRPDHTRRLTVLGVALTETLYMAPVALIAAFLTARRRRDGQPDGDESGDADARGPPEEEEEKEWTPPAWWDKWWWRASTFLAGAFALSLTGTLVHTCNLDSHIDVEEASFADEFETPYVRVAPQQAGLDAPLAVLVHGWRCSHQMMMPLARMLARNGVEAYAVDLPGHADSPIELDASCRPGRKAPCRAGLGRMFTTSLAGVLEGMQEAGTLEGRDVVLIGHSSGGIAVAEVEVPAMGQPDARIILEGAISKFRPGRDQLFLGRGSKVKKYPNAPVNRTKGSFDDGSAWRAAKINIPHLAFVRNQKANKEMLDWIERTTEAELGDDTRHHHDTYILASGLSVAVGAFGWIALLGFGRRRGWLPRFEPTTPARGWIAFLCVVFGGLAAALWAGELYRSGNAWQMARIRQTLPIFLGLASVTVAIPYVALAWRPRNVRLRPVVRDVLVGLAGTVVLFGSYAAVADAYYFHAQFALWRLPSVIGWGLAILPVALVVREVGPKRPGMLRQVLAILARITVWGLLLGVHGLGRSSSGMSEVMSAVGVIVGAELFSIATGALLRSRLAPAVTIAFGVAWAQVAAYPVMISTTV